MKNSKIYVSLLCAALLFAACSDWTETESIGQKVSTPEKTDPAAYAAYAAKVRAYKKSDHKVLIAAFDNTERPSSPGQMVAMLPDSTDIVALLHPAKLSEADREGVQTLRELFATRVICAVDEFADAAAAVAFADGAGLDGFLVGPSASPELVAGLSAVAGPGKSRMLVLEGAALHLTGDQHERFDFNVLATADVGTTFEVRQQVDFARQIYGFADKQVLLTTAIGATITDDNLVKREQLPLLLAMVEDLGPLGGLSVAGIESDYYHAGGNFLVVRDLIKKLNPQK